MKIHRYHLVIIIVILLLNLNISQAQIIKEKTPGIKEYGLEFLGATAGEIIIGIPAFIVSAIATPSYEHEIIPGSFIIGCIGGYVVGTAVGAPSGTILTGKLLHQNGSKLGAYCGGVIGTGLGLLSAYLYNNATANVQQNSWPAVITTSLLLPPLLSVVGYNLFPSKKSSSTSLFEKYAPQCAVTCNPIKYNNRIIPEIGMKFVVNF